MVMPALAIAPARSDERGNDPTVVWQRVLSRLQLNTPANHFATYLRDTRGLAYDPTASVIRVAAANPFHVPWLEGKLSSAIHAAVAETLEAPIRVEFDGAGHDRPDGAPAAAPRRPAPLLAHLEETNPSASSARVDDDVFGQAQRARPAAHTTTGSTLNARYTFDSFVVG